MEDGDDLIAEIVLGNDIGLSPRPDGCPKCAYADRQAAVGQETQVEHRLKYGAPFKRRAGHSAGLASRDGPISPV